MKALKIRLKNTLLIVALIMLLFSVGKISNLANAEGNTEVIIPTISSENPIGEEDKNITFAWPEITKFEYYDFSQYAIVSRGDLNTFDVQFFEEGAGNYSSEAVYFKIGKYKAVVSHKDASYTVVNPDFYFEIDYTYLDIDWGESSYKYTDEIITKNPQLVGDLKGKEVTINFDTSASILSAKNVGTYNIKVLGLSDEYFRLSSSAETDFTWEITTRELEVSWGNNNFTYTGTTHTPLASGVDEGFNIPLVVTEENSLEISGAGEYNLVASLPSGYSGFVLKGNITSICSVSPIEVEVEFKCDDTYTYNGNYVEIVPTLKTVIQDEIKIILKNHYFKDAGVYVAETVGTDNPNYSVKFTTFNWEIKPKEIELQWGPSIYPYTGSTIRPKPYPIVTGIPGKSLTPVVTSGQNREVNFGSEKPYVVTASLPEGETNFTLSNVTHEYYIEKAKAYLRVNPIQKIVCDGNRHLPEFEYVGDEGNLQIFINGVESANGVKDAGVYKVEFKSPESAHYYAFNQNYVIEFEIIPDKLVTRFGDLSVIVGDKTNGINSDNFEVKEVKEYDTELINSYKKYNMLKAFSLKLFENRENQNFSLAVRIDKIKPELIKVLALTENGVVEKSVEIVDGKLNLDAEDNTYFILVAKDPFLKTTAGVVTLIVGVFVVISSAFILVIVFRKKSEEEIIAKIVTKRIKEKIKLGEEITSEEIEKLRQEVKTEIESKESLSDKSQK